MLFSKDFKVYTIKKTLLLGKKLLLNGVAYAF